MGHQYGKTRSYCSLGTLLLLITIETLVGTRTGNAQTQPMLQITSPAEGSVVNPGQSISVNVISLTKASFAIVTIIGQDPLPMMVGNANTLPAHFSLTVPKEIALRKYALTAMGATTDRQIVYSDPITIEVDRPDLPTQLRVEPDRLFFEGQSGASPLRIAADFSDIKNRDVSESSNLYFATSNPEIATVNASGMVKPIAEGTAIIMASYTKAGKSISVSIPVKVRRSLVSVSPPSLHFGRQTVGKSTSQTLSVTNHSSDSKLRVGTSLRAPEFGPGDPTRAGSFSQIDNCAPSSPLPVGATCTVNLEFKPTVPGLNTATLFVWDSLYGLPREVPLTGFGVEQSSMNALSDKNDQNQKFPNIKQNLAELEIASPADNSLVSPGQPISIQVISPAHVSAITVSLIGEVPIGTPPPANSLPAQFRLTIPADITPGRYSLTAVGKSTEGGDLASNHVTIDVERDDLPTRITTLITSIVFPGLTHRSPLTIYGQFSDGTSSNVTKSSNLRFSSSNPAVVAVDANGMLTPVSQGTATITATYTHAGRSINTSLPTTVYNQSTSGRSHVP
jgi:centrosomal CEP192-like protein/Big-like domain-containing protein